MLLLKLKHLDYRLLHLLHPLTAVLLQFLSDLLQGFFLPIFPPEKAINAMRIPLIMAEPYFWRTTLSCRIVLHHLSSCDCPFPDVSVYFVNFSIKNGTISASATCVCSAVANSLIASCCASHSRSPKIMA